MGYGHGGVFKIQSQHLALRYQMPYAQTQGPGTQPYRARTKWVTVHAPDTALTGSTSLNSVFVAFHKVRVYNRDTGKLIKHVISDAGGLFTIRGLPIAADRYLVTLEQQSEDAGSYNLDAFDHVSQT